MTKIINKDKEDARLREKELMRKFSDLTAEV